MLRFCKMKIEGKISPQLFSEILLSLLPEIPAAAIAPLHDAHQLRTYLPDELMMREGDTCGGVFLLCSGRVGMSLSLPNNGEEQLLPLRELSEPAALGLSGMMLGKIATVNLAASTEVEAAFILRDDFLNVLHHFPAVGVSCSKLLVEELIETNACLAEFRRHAESLASARVM